MRLSKPRALAACTTLALLGLNGCGGAPQQAAPSGEATASTQDAVLDPGVNYTTLATSGHSLCGGRGQAPCSNEAGTFLRAFVNHTPSDCPSGSFHDLIYGGSCWSCPEGYIRSLTPVVDDDACWQAAHPVYKSATRHTTGTLFFWDCPSGKFWDGWDGGGCWTCDPYVGDDGTEVTTIRNVSPIWQSDACWGSTAHSVLPASLEKLLGCPSTTPGKETPDGKPFRDPVNYDGDPATANKVGDYGTCWSCPDFSERTAFPVFSSDACDVKFKWQSAKYPEPGIFGLYGLAGAADLLAEILEDPADVTDTIYAMAGEAQIAPEDVAQFVEDEWATIRDRPARSEVLKGILLVRLISNITNYALLPEGSADKRFVDDFAAYIVSRRTFVARGALDMYDTWKDGVDYFYEINPQGPLAGAFYIGTVPPDFRRVAEDDWVGLATAGVPVLGAAGAFASAAVYSAFLPTKIISGTVLVGGVSQAVDKTVAATNMARLFANGVAYAVRAGATTAQAVTAIGSVVAGSTIIAAVGGVLISISIDQFIKIQTARPDLVASLDAAQVALTPTSLETFSGTDAFGYNWALATTEELENGVPKLETRCHPQIDATVTDAACFGYLKVARAARTAELGAAAASYLPSFAAPPLLSFLAPTIATTYSNANVQVQARATDTDGVHALTCTDGGASVTLSTASSDEGRTLDGTTTATAEGTHLFACRATDLMGFTTATPVETTVVVDRTAPALTAGLSPQPNGAGWNNSDVTVAFQCADTLSGIGADTVPDALVQTQGVTSVTSTGTCSDRAGNTATAASVSVSLDKTAPSIQGSRAPAANGFGWNNAAVVASFTCSDALSGIASCPAQQTLSADGTNQSATGQAVDRADNSASTSVSGINIDTVAPTIGAAISPAANVNGWNNSVPVTVTFTCADALSGVASCTTPASISTETASQTASGTAHDRAGNTAGTSATVRVDTTAPTIGGAVQPAANGYGWNNTAVVATFTCGDALSTIATCTAPQTLSADGASQSVTGEARDRADNTASVTLTGISIDRTAPAVAVTGVANAGVYVRGAVPAAGCSTSDALSGVLTAAALAVTGGTSNDVGFYTASCTGASDRAGNGASATAGYQVVYPFTPSVPPVLTPAAGNPVSAGARVPVKFRLGGDFGLDVLSAGSPRSQRVDCGSRAAIGSAAPTSGAFGYDPTTGEYKYEWKTEKAWRGTCRMFFLGLDDGAVRPIFYAFK